MKLVISKTPLRISLFGGGTDLKSYYKFKNGAVLSLSINKYLYVILKKNEKVVDFKYRINWSKTEFTNKISQIEHPLVREIFKYFKINFPIEVSTFSDIPANSGLGSSSAFAVGLISCISKLQKLNYSREKICSIAAKIEIDILKRNIGKQDHYASAYGGFNLIEFKKKGSVIVKNIILNKSLENKIISSFFVIFLKKQRNASDILSNQKNLKKINFNYLTEIKKIVYEGIEHLDKKTFTPKIIGQLLSKNWCFKKKNNIKVSYRKVDKIYKEGLNLGAYGGKLLGAGGGGYFLFLINKKRINKFRKKFFKYPEIKVKIAHKGTEIIYNINEK